jgi:hypothetical protein
MPRLVADHRLEERKRLVVCGERLVVPTDTTQRTREVGQGVREAGLVAGGLFRRPSSVGESVRLLDDWRISGREGNDKMVRNLGSRPSCRSPGQGHIADDRFRENLQTRPPTRVSAELVAHGDPPCAQLEDRDRHSDGAIGRTTNVSAHAGANDEERCWPVTNPTSGSNSG